MTYLKKGLLALLMIVPLACKKPTDNLKIVVDTNIIKYTALINVMDASSGAVPANAAISIGGAAADDIYEVSGKKVFTLSGGNITIGLGPSISPSAGTPVSCTITITAPGYNSITVPVTFTADVLQQVVTVSLSKVTTSTSTTTSPTSSAPASTSNQAVSLNFTGTCANRPNLQIKPSLYIFYRISNSGAPFQFLGYMNSGKITTTALATGKAYQFEITYNGQSYTATQDIEQSGYDITIDLGTACSNF